MRTKRLIRAIVGALALATVLPVLPLNSASAAYGELDTTYGGNGTGYNYLAITDSNIAFPIEDSNVMASTLDGQGRLVVAGYTSYDDGDRQAFAVARFNANGTLDTTFGANQSGFVSLRRSQLEQFNTVKLQSDGKIVLGGRTRINSYDAWVLARLLTDGSLDTSFGSAGTGYQTTVFAIRSEVTSIAVTASDEIIAGGYSIIDPNVSSISHPTIAKYSRNGLLDNSFGTYGNGFETYTVDNDSAGIHALGLKPSGEIVAVGYGQGVSFRHLFITSWSSNGTLNLNFGGHGTGYDTTTISSSTTSYKALGFQSDGKIIAGGSRDSGQLSLLARYASDGTLDQSFGTSNNGFIATQVQDESEISSIVIDSNDSIFYGGYSRLGTNPFHFLVGKRESNGLPDTSFGANQGYFLDSRSDSDLVSSIQINSSGEILIAGGSRFLNGDDGNFAVGRLRASISAPVVALTPPVPDPIQQSVIETVTVTGETITSIVLTGKFPEPIVNIVVNQAPIAPTEWQQTPVSVTIPEVEPGNYTVQIFNGAVPLLPEQKVSVVKVVPPAPAPTPQVTTEPTPPIKVETPEPVVTPVASDSFKVYFAMASARLDKKSKDSITAWFNEAGVNAKMLNITGYAQATPKGAALDPALSSRRARAVKNFFIELGYSGKFRTSGAGRTTLNNPESRYVEVVTP
jgi:uncharacterized delta-60 repeat protein